MQKKQIAGWLMATVLIAGSGVALAEGGSNGPSLPDKANEHAVTAVAKANDDTTTTAGDTTTDAESPKAAENAGGNANTNDNHGAVVSAAAQDHSHDAECGNHGKYVSAVAQGETTCTTTTGEVHGASADHSSHAGGK